MNYGKINKADIANGSGVRVSLFVSGCRNHCKGCFNEATWDFNYGTPFTSKEEDEIIEALKPSYIDGLTILGGEPFEPENQERLAPFIKKVRALYPNKTIWMYSGYLFDKEMIPQNGKVHTPYTMDILNNIDILVDGRFVCELLNLALKFRGSENQRIILVKESLSTGEVKLSPLNEFKNFKPEE
jgi:anaerobic ribonucleoside-triphosphate reductase activating protein